jgi:hypothetical protein
MTTKIHFIGHDGERVVNSQATQDQIDTVRALRCDLVDSDEAHEPLSWDDIDNPAEFRTLFQSILGDRRVRVDQHTLMADRPPFAVVTELDGAAVRLEFYEGRDELECTCDVRSRALQGKDLPRWMDADPHAYDPVAYLSEVLGVPPEISAPLLGATHEPGTPGLAPSYDPDVPGKEPDANDRPR